MIQTEFRSQRSRTSNPSTAPTTQLGPDGARLVRGSAACPTCGGVPCASWRDDGLPRQVALHGTGWSTEQVAAFMDGWAWMGDPQTLEQGFTLRLQRPMRASVRRAPSGRGDDLFVVWPADQLAPR